MRGKGIQRVLPRALSKRQEKTKEETKDDVNAQDVKELRNGPATGAMT